MVSIPVSCIPLIVAQANRPIMSFPVLFIWPMSSPVIDSRLPPSWYVFVLSVGDDVYTVRDCWETASIMKSYFHLLVWVHGLLVSERPCISVPMFIILSISVVISNPLLMLDPLMFWNQNLVYPLLSCCSRSGSPAGDMFVFWFCGGGLYWLSFVCCHLHHVISCYVYVNLLLGMSLIIGLFAIRQMGAAHLGEW
jgi:hypothetical protein